MKNLSKYVMLALCSTILFVQCDILNPPITFSTTNGIVIGILPNNPNFLLDSVKIEVDGSVRDISKADGSFAVSGLTRGKSYRFRLLGLSGDSLLDSTITIQANDTSLPNDKQTAKKLEFRIRLTGKEMISRFFWFPMAVGNEWNYDVIEVRKDSYNGMTFATSTSWKASILITGKSVQNQDTLWNAKIQENQITAQYPFRQTDSTLSLWEYTPLVSSSRLFRYGYWFQIPLYSERSIIPNDTLKQIVVAHLVAGNATAKIVHNVGIVEIFDTEGFRMNAGVTSSRETTYTLKSYTLK